MPLIAERQKGSEQTSAVTLARVCAGSRGADHVVGDGNGRRVSGTATFSIGHPAMTSLVGMFTEQGYLR